MADFSIAVKITLSVTHEGGFQDNKNDVGNWTGGKIGVGELKGTNMGISARWYPAVDIKNLTVEQASSIYQLKYWNPLYAQIKEQDLCNKLFDMGVLMGEGTAVKILQQVLQPHFNIVPDASFGPKTLEAVNASEPTSLLLAYKTALVARAIADGAANEAQRAFVATWIRRINS
jgi:lysozyme family protein